MGINMLNSLISVKADFKVSGYSTAEIQITSCVLKYAKKENMGNSPIETGESQD